jgi:hypothetical protein
MPPCRNGKKDSFLRKPRKSRKSRKIEQDENRSESPIRDSSDIPLNNINSLLAEEYGRIDYGVPDDGSAEDTPLLLRDTDPEQIFNRKWGYLLSLDEEAVAVIKVIIADLDMAKGYTRISPDYTNFSDRLQNRNVLLEESQIIDL